LECVDVSGLASASKGGVMRLLMVVNVDWFFLSHRLAIAQAALEAGYEVHVATALTRHRSELEQHGFIVHPLNIHRSSTGLLGLFFLLLNLIQLFWRIRPDVVHLVTIKPVLLGGIAARLSPVRRVVFAISGLGHIFLAQDWRGRIKRGLVSLLYRLALGVKDKCVIFQNGDDRRVIESVVQLKSSQIVMIPGSGVDLNQYPFIPVNTVQPVVMMASRLLWTKGVREYTEICLLLAANASPARFLLVGDRDAGNPDSVTEADIAQWKSSGVIEILGHRENIAQLMAQSTIVVLPSYREGFPKVLIEAAACGRAVVTTDVPGCRDAVVANQTGLLVPAKNTEALADAVQTLIEDPALCVTMGQAGRLRAEALFDIQQVVAIHLNIYKNFARG
jgi:glycosyltransferase involved in cell wall biosynthesis